MMQPWWSHPGRLTGFFIIPLYAFLVYVVPAQWPNVIVLRAPDYIHRGYAGVGLLMLGSLTFFSFLGARIVVRRAAPRPSCIASPVLLGVGAVTIAAYVVWFFPIVLHAQLMLERDELSQAPGITSFSQMGVPFVLSCIYCARVAGQRFSSLVRGQFWAIVFLTLIRMVVWKERLAAIEVFVPAALLILTYGMPRAKGKRALRSAIALGGPFLAVPLLMLVFGVTEYFRSWTTYAHTQRAPLVEFMLARVTTYYYTALNNGAGLLATRHGEWPAYKMLFTAQWIYKLPAGIGDWVYQITTGPRAHPTDEFLSRFGDIEFNNMSGLFTIIYDLGIVGGAFYFAALGLAAGMLYRSMVRGGRVGALLYPPIFVGLLEVLRIAYVNSSRCILIFGGAYLILSQMRSSEEASSVDARERARSMPLAAGPS